MYASSLILPAHPLPPSLFPHSSKMSALKKQVIMVTGGSGLVGSAIKSVVEKEEKKENESWVFLSSKDGDLRVRADCDKIFAKFQPTHVIHLAAKVGGLFANMKEKVEFYRENIIMNDNVMECCRIATVDKLVSYLSTCIFPDKTTDPIDETMLHDGPPHSSNAGYAYAKRMVDTMNRAYNEEYGCNFTSIIPTNIYGPSDNYNIQSGHVIPGLIHKCFIAKRDGTPFSIWGSGTPLRQFMYSEDLAKLTLWVMRDYHSPEPIICSVDESAEVSIRDVALAVAKGMDFEGEVVFDSTKADGQFKKTASNKKLRTHLPDYKFVEMEDGIRRSCEWFSANYATARK